jgi:DNA-binding PadR family transcriptional regulator
MSLDHALLVSLLEKPSAGYALARRFDRSIGHFWHASHQQIYKVLARMEQQGWVECEVCAGETAPDSKVFRVTPLGRTALADWLCARTEPEILRAALLVKLRATAFDNPQHLRDELSNHLSCHQAMLKKYRDIADRDFSGPLDMRGELQHQVLRFGLAYETTWIAWCQETLHLIDRLTPPTETPQETP